MGRSRKLRTGRPASFADILIPDKLYFRIGEVSELTETEPYVLRYWEKEFPTLRPERKSKQRLYRRKDVETVFIIKRLLYQEGFTIEGARKQLSSNSEELKQQTLLRSAPDGIELKAIKRELESILTILSRKC
ncbi:MAG: MerR family transcriptional regulator [Acidobacteria bacterium]|nr:MAG: MerR family transcriptional regulator [Acidobacteriota bacterium]